MTTSPASSPNRDRVAAPGRMRPWARRLVSVLLVWHLAAMAAGPFSADPAASRLAFVVADFFRPYLDAIFMNHGYNFFAPEPGPSHLIRYEIEMPDGSRREGVFPNLDEQRPRLLYHRHFMLSEWVNGIPSDEPPPAAVARPGGNDPDALPPSRYRDVFLRGYADRLLHESGGRRVELFLVRHLIPSPADVMDGMRLDDPRLYIERRLGVFEGAAP